MKKAFIISAILGVLSANLFVPAIASAGNYNRAPVWDYTGDKTVYAGQTLQFSVNAADPDNDFLYYDILNLPSGSWFANPTHTFYWVPSQDQVGNFVITFSVSDGNAIVYKNVNVAVLTNQPAQPTVTPVPITAPPASYNNPPQFYGFAPTGTARVNELYTYDLNATDADNDPLTYSLISAPAGMAINSATGYIAWVPVVSQLGANSVRVAVSDGKMQTAADFSVTVSPAVNPAPAPTPAPSAAPSPAPAPAEAKFVISDIKFENKDGEIVIRWQTNIAATDRAIWDTASQADKKSNFSYAHATPENTDRSITHSANLGKLDINTVYYLRVVSKTDHQTAVSQEIAFIQLENGQVQSLFGASLFQIFGSLFRNAAFLWILIVVFGAAAIIYYRKHKTNLKL